jgi:hypothetical protein
MVVELLMILKVGEVVIYSLMKAAVGQLIQLEMGVQQLMLVEVGVQQLMLVEGVVGKSIR